LHQRQQRRLVVILGSQQHSITQGHLQIADLQAESKYEHA
jgi:hypothetical protein